MAKPSVASGFIHTQGSISAAGSWQGTEGAATALAVGYGVQYHLSSMPWLAKDFIWVIPDSRCGLEDSMSVWLNEYQAEVVQHNMNAQGTKSNILTSRITEMLDPQSNF